MPPKAFMKFKPKTDTRKEVEVKKEDAMDVDQAVSAFQQQRIQQEQQQQQQPQLSSSTTAGGRPTIDTAAAAKNGSGRERAGASPKLGPNQPGPGGRGSRGAPQSMTLPSNIGGGGVATVSHHGGGSIRTDTLPENTADDLANYVDPVTNDTRFLPSQARPKLPADPAEERIKAEEEKKLKDEEGDAAPTEVAREQKVDGTAFLREHLKEDNLVRNQNIDFFITEQQLVKEEERLDGGEKKMMFMQLPTPQSGAFQKNTPAGAAGSTASTPALSTIPPGKVGKLRVRRSGKTELVIGDSVYEIQMESLTNQASMTAEVVAILPSPAQDGTTCCYELGQVDRKAVCTAIPTESLQRRRQGGGDHNNNGVGQ